LDVVDWRDKVGKSKVGRDVTDQMRFLQRYFFMGYEKLRRESHDRF